MKILADRFAPVPVHELNDMLNEVELNTDKNFRICVAICHFTNFKRSITIGDEKYFTGDSIAVATETIADMADISRSRCNEKLILFEQKGILKRKRVGHKFSYRLKFWQDLENEKKGVTLAVTSERNSKGNSKGNSKRNSSDETVTLAVTPTVTQTDTSEGTHREKRKENPPLKSPEKENDDDESSKDDASVGGGFIKSKSSEYLQRFRQVFSPDEQINASRHRQWFNAMKKVVSYVFDDSRMVKTFGDVREDKVVWVMDRVFRYYEGSGNPPQWPGFIMQNGLSVVNDFISQAIQRDKPIEHPEPLPKLTKEEKETRVENMQQLRKDVRETTGVEVASLPVVEDEIEGQEQVVKTSAMLAMDLMPLADTLAEHLDSKPHERIDCVKNLRPDIEWAVYDTSPGVILRAINLVLYESGHKKPVN